MFKRILCLFIVAALSLTAMQQTVAAVAEFNEDYYSMQDILWFNPSATEPCGTTQASVGGSAAPLSNIPEPWGSLISQTASKYPDVDARLVAASLFVENRGWPDYNTKWATSPAGAKGPWQFIPSTWASLGVDGDSDGKTEADNPKDAVHGAFKHHTGSAGKPITIGYSGDLEAGLDLKFYRKSDNLLYYMAKYNGSGAADGTTIKNLSGNENSNYVKMSYYVLASNFTQQINPTSGEVTDIDKNSASSMGVADSNSCGTLSGVGSVNAEGFSFPVGIPKSYVDNNSRKWPCPDSCHHDGSGAFDLFDKRSASGTTQDNLTTGKPVYMIEDATIDRIRDSYQGESGCQTISLTGKSGWKYWYGHIQKVSIKPGQTVKAGTQVAVIGERRCTGNGSLPHLHIDRGPSQGASGGNAGANASKTLVPIINKLYEELPG